MKLLYSISKFILYLILGFSKNGKQKIKYKTLILFLFIGVASTQFLMAQDTDGDGVPDVTDIDDDNDGILDINESSVLLNTWTLDPNSTGTGVTQSGNLFSASGTPNFMQSYGTVPISTLMNGVSDYDLSFTLSNTSQLFMIGFNEAGTNSTASFTDIDFALYPVNGSLQVYENGVLRGTFGTYAANDVLSVRKTGTVITYLVNNTVRYTSIVAASASDYYIDTSFHSGTYTVNNLILSTVGQPFDSDADTIANTVDLDSDNDGIPDNIEAQTTNGYITPGTFTDIDGDGLNDVYDADTGDTSTAASIGLTPVDTDSDGLNDFLDLDSDADGTDDVDESGLGAVGAIQGNGLGTNVGGSTTFTSDDVNGIAHDGTNFLLADTDNDTDADGNNANAANDIDLDYRDTFAEIDTDGDGIFDRVDIDDDNDGILDAIEKNNKAYIYNGTTIYRYDLNSDTGVSNQTFIQTISDLGFETAGAAQDNFGLGMLDGKIYLYYGISIFSYDFDPDTGASNQILIQTITDPAFEAGIAGIDHIGLGIVDDKAYVYNGTSIYSYDFNPATGVSNPILIQTINDIAFESSIAAADNFGLGIIDGKAYVYNGTAIYSYDFDPATGVSNPILIQTVNDIVFENGPTAGQDNFGLGILVNLNGIDNDNDGIPNDLDLDSDNDGIPDNIEAQTTNGYIAPGTFTDTNNDGLNDAFDAGVIAGGAHTGIGLTPVDTDSDGLNDFLDLDSDADGTDDVAESGLGAVGAIQGNGLGTNVGGSTTFTSDDVNGVAHDATNFLLDDTDNDTDADGNNANATNAIDLDYRDNINDIDTDGDTIFDRVDIDDDNDGILDINESSVLLNTWTLDPNSTGTGVTQSGNSFSASGTPNFMQSYGIVPISTLMNGVSDYDLSFTLSNTSQLFMIGFNEAGTNSTASFTDIDFALYPGNGSLQVYENGVLRGTFGTYAANDVLSVRKTGTVITYLVNNTVRYTSIVAASASDYYIDTSFHSGTYTVNNLILSTVGQPFDSDADTIANTVDLDSDNDGIPDNIEAQTTNGYITPGTFTDIDGDGLNDVYDADTGDTSTVASIGLTPVDTDSDSTSDYLDSDSDADGTDDVDESGLGAVGAILGNGLGTNVGGSATFTSDDVNGIAHDGTNFLLADTDNDTDADGNNADAANALDLDYRDNINDIDTDGDTIFDRVDIDDDNDGILDTYEASIPVTDWTKYGTGTTATATGNTISVTSGTVSFNEAINSDDFSTLGITGNFVFRFTLDQATSKTSMIGVNRSGDNTTPVYTDIDYAIYLAGTDIQIYENGVLRGSFGVQTAGDVYSIHKEGTVITYRRNGTTFYTSTIPATEPDYYIDSSFNSDGGNPYSLSNIQLSSSLILNNDIDADGIDNDLDLDSDNDGIPDTIEAQTTNGYIAPGTFTDTNNDGLNDAFDTGVIAGGAHTGVGLTPVDTDSDSTPDYLDTDSDADGTDDVDESGLGVVGAIQGNGLGTNVGGSATFTSDDVNGEAHDGTNFLLDDTDNDTDADGNNANAANGTDLDYRDAITDVDTDGDGLFDRVDIDDDNDGILDTYETSIPVTNWTKYGTGTNVAVTGNSFSINGGSAAWDEGINSDNFSTLGITGDFVFSFITQDNGSSVNVMIGVNRSGDNTTASFEDIDYAIYLAGGGIRIYENGGNKGTFGTETSGDIYTIHKEGTVITYRRNGTTFYTSTIPATEPDYYIDSSFLNIVGANPYIISDIQLSSVLILNNDIDADGIDNDKDLDSDNDGIPDTIEAQTTNGYIAPGTFTDTNNDGLNDAFDTGVIAGGAHTGVGLTPVDTDSDGASDYVDLDSDCDGTNDVDESGLGAVGAIQGNGLGTNVGGSATFTNDDVNGVAHDGTNFLLADTDNDTDADGNNANASNAIDLDYRDNIFDGDTDGDGVFDRVDVDDDNDGILDINEINPINLGVADGTFESGTASSNTPNGLGATSGWSAVLTVDLFTDVVASGISQNVAEGMPNSPEGGVFAGILNSPINMESMFTTISGLEIGTEYKVRFYQAYAGWVGDTPGDVANFNVIFGADTQASNSMTFLGAGNQVWELEELIFTATSTSQQLTFQPILGAYLAIDGVTVFVNDADFDNDGIQDNLDLDSDNDGIPDNIEAQTTNGYIAPGTFTDTNNDGLNDAFDTGVIAGGAHTGIGLTLVDTDSDGLNDFLDLDSDADGTDDVDESGLGAVGAIQGNGLGTNVGGSATFTSDDVNGEAHDGTNFLLDDTDNDTDADGNNANAANGTDLDYRDNINDIDTDGDTIFDRVDIDDDNDGILDVFETSILVTNWTKYGSGTTATATGNTINVTSGTVSFNEAINSNNFSTLGITGDFVFRFTLDQATSKTSMIGVNRSGDNTTAVYTDIDYAIYLAGTNIQIFENGASRGSFGVQTAGDVYSIHKEGTVITYRRNGTTFYISTIPATEPDYYIDSSFNSDGGNPYSLSNIELSNGIILNNDIDADGINNDLDLDSDNDGIPDNIEAQTTNGYITPGTFTDIDGDGLNDVYDADTGDISTANSIGLTPVDTDTDGTSDYIDLDSDADGTDDVAESGLGAVGAIQGNGLGTNVGGSATFTSDDVNGEAHDGTNFLLDDTDNDTDADGSNANAANAIDLDYRDNIIDVDTDGDGVSDRVDIDDDNDGILDVVEQPSLVTTYSYTGTDQVITIPANVTAIEVQIWGAGGGGSVAGLFSTGGAGGFVSGTYNVSEGQNYTLVVGEGGRSDGASLDITYGFGGNGHSVNTGSNGGGLSGIFTGSSTVLSTDESRAIMIAGGGGSGERDGSNVSSGGQGGDTTFAGGLTNMQGGNASFVGGGGGGGFKGGLSNQTRISQPLVAGHGEGGSSYILPSVSNGVSLFTADIAALPNPFSITTNIPPNDSSIDYVSGVGVGTSVTSSKGGNGLIVVKYIIDTDDDGINNDLDLDSDNDGIPDNIEAQTTNGYIAPGTFTDIDGDGLNDVYDADTGDTSTVASIGLTPVDTDSDSTSDYLDLDSDADGTTDVDESGLGAVGAIQGNGLGTNVGGSATFTSDDVNGEAHDVTNFLLADTDNDTDADGNNANAANDIDLDYRDTIAEVDTDGDTIFDRVDIDDDNDGILDIFEVGGPITDWTNYGSGTSAAAIGNTITFTASTGPTNGWNEAINSNDFSTQGITGDFVFSFILDNALYKNVMIGVNRSGDNTTASFTDIDYTIFLNETNVFIYENGVSRGGFGAQTAGGIYSIHREGTVITYRINGTTFYTSTIPATESDYYIDSSFYNIGGGFTFSLSNIEVVFGDVDVDADSINNDLDLDSDNDGIPDNIEAQTTNGYIAPGTFTDIDGDGLNDVYDADTGDTSTAASIGLTPVGTDTDSTPDYLDLDSDADGTNDVDENFNPLISVTNATVGINGLENAAETTDNYTDVNGNAHDGTNFLLADTDNDTDADGSNANATNGTDLDYRDAITDIDTDGDTIFDRVDIDDDNDGILDTNEEIELSLGGADGTFESGTASSNTPNGLASTSGWDVTLTADLFTNVVASGISQNIAEGTPNSPEGGVFAGIINDPSYIASIYTTISGLEIGAQYKVRFYQTYAGWQSDTPGDVANFNVIFGADTQASNSMTFLGAGNQVWELEELIFTATSASQQLTFRPISGSYLGIDGITVTSIDSDNDSITNSLDLDSDNDGIPDNIEAQTTNGYIAPGIFTDIDGDGLNDVYDADTGDTSTTASVGLTPVDTDSDGTLDYVDLDSDADGTTDVDESGLGAVGAIQGNGLGTNVGGSATFTSDDVNGIAHDGTNFLLADTDNDTDADGNNANTVNAIDLDYRDNINDIDTDGDTIFDRFDIDDDNDGILDTNEENELSLGAADGTFESGTASSNTPNGLASTSGWVTTLTADLFTNVVASGISQNIGEGTPNSPEGGVFAGIIHDGGGYVESISTTVSGLEIGAQYKVRFYQTYAGWVGDTPGDIANFNVIFGVDTQASNSMTFLGAGNQVWELEELTFTATSASQQLMFTSTSGSYLAIDGVTVTSLDSDNDGIQDNLDLDSDNDGIPDNIEAQTTNSYIAPGIFTDIDGDGLNDVYDVDTGDTSTTASVGLTPVDTDSDGTPDYVDLDSDSDGIDDVAESGLGAVGAILGNGLGTNVGGSATFTSDDVNGNAHDSTNFLLDDTDNDTDADGGNADAANGIDLDYRDNINDIDTDGDTIFDRVDIDDDNDGILDTNEGTELSLSGADGTFESGTASSNTPNGLGATSGWSTVLTVDLFTNVVASGISQNIAEGTPNSPEGGIFATLIHNAASHIESISTTVSGLEIGVQYKVRFYQTYAGWQFDTPGDVANFNVMFGVDTQASNSMTFLGAGNQVWELEELIFTATSASQQLTFTPTSGSSLGIDGVTVISIDSDNDGIQDSLDLDSDNDGIPDNIEAQTTNGYIAPGTFTDIDGDGLNDIYDADTGDTSTAGSIGLIPVDTDTDSTPDYLDLDSDGDGSNDVDENFDPLISVTNATVGVNGLENAAETIDNYTDVNGNAHNGTNFLLADTDNDTDANGNNANAANAIDLDYRDAINDVDTDGDTIFDREDIDDDNDGILDINEGLVLLNTWTLDPNSTGTGVTQSGNSFSASGTPNWTQSYYTVPISTLVSGVNDYELSFTLSNTSQLFMIGFNEAGTNSTASYTDIDFALYAINGDLLVFENGANPGTFGTYAANDVLSVRKTGTVITYLVNNTVRYTSAVAASASDYYIDASFHSGTYTVNNLTLSSVGQLFDNDADTIDNTVDLDSDNDGIPDNIEAQTTNGYIAPGTFTDIDGDGLNDIYDADTGDTSTAASIGLTPVDTDSDSTPDYVDLDSDGDGTNDVDENFNPLISVTNATVGINGLENAAETIDNYTDVNGNAHDGTNFLLADTDNDTDADGGNANAANGIDLDYRDAITDVDTDGDTIFDRVDIDDDNDGILDIDENGKLYVYNGTDIYSYNFNPIVGIFNPTLIQSITSSHFENSTNGQDNFSLGIVDGKAYVFNGASLNSYDFDPVTGVSNPTGLPSSGGAAFQGGAAGIDNFGLGIVDGKAYVYDGNSIYSYDLNSVTGISNQTLIQTITDSAFENSTAGQDNFGLGIYEGKAYVYNGTAIYSYDFDPATGVSNPILIQTINDIGFQNSTTGIDNFGLGLFIDSNGIDNDGIQNSLDLDSDNDGIPDNIEAQTTNGYIAPGTFTDTNNDGLNDAFDAGIIAGGAHTGIGLTPVDTDDDGTPDYLDDDSDADGTDDVAESGLGAVGTIQGNGLGTNVGGSATFTSDDVNGVAHDATNFLLDDTDNDTDANGNNANAANSIDLDYRDNITDVDTDADGISDRIDIDDDNDGILDVVEDGKLYVYNGTNIYSYNFNPATGVSNSTLIQSITSSHFENLTAGQDNFSLGIYEGKAYVYQGVSIASYDFDPVTGVSNLISIQSITDAAFQPGTAGIGNFSLGISGGKAYVYNGTAIYSYDFDPVTGVSNPILIQTINDSAFENSSTGQDNFGLGISGGKAYVYNGTAIYSYDFDTTTGVSNPILIQTINDIGFQNSAAGIDNFGLGLFIDSNGIDNDGIQNSLDLDSDNDGIPDNIEAQTTNGYIAPGTFTDTNNDGLNDAFDAGVIAGGAHTGVGLSPVDTDTDGTSDFIDTDSDGDGTTDVDENFDPLISVTNATVGVNGLENAAETTDNYTDVNGNAHDGTNFLLADTDNDTDADGGNADAANGIDLDYRDIKSDVIITQVYENSGNRVIELTNISTNTIAASSINIAYYADASGDQTGVTPTATYTVAGSLAPNQSVLIESAGLTGVNINNAPIREVNAGITAFDAGNDILILSTTTDTTAWTNRIDVMESIANTSSLVRNDNIVDASKSFNSSQWTIFVNDGLDPYRVIASGGPERHVHDPLISEVNTSVADKNQSLGYHRTGATVRSGAAWSNGLPDRSRSIIISEDYTHSGSSLAIRDLTLNTDSKLVITDNLLVVTDNITLSGTNDEIRLIGTSQLVSTHTSGSLVTGNGKLYVDQNSEVPSTYRYNYFGSPVNSIGASTYTVADVFKDGSTPTSAISTATDINFIGGYNGAATTPISIAEYWIYGYGVEADWTQKLSAGTIPQTDGVIFKGPGQAQNYTFVGTPKDGTMQTTVAADTDYLVGNPYASAISVQRFLEDNLASTTGAVYFWEQKESINGDVDQDSHNFDGYVGGYAIRNIAMGLAANNPLNTVNDNIGIAGLGSGSYREPGAYIPIGQGFFIEGSVTGGTVEFNNSQREFVLEGANAIFFRNGDNTNDLIESSSNTSSTNTLPIIKLGMDYVNQDNLDLHQQIGISFLQSNSFGFEVGYDATLADDLVTGFYWDFENDDENYAIAGVQEITDNLEVPLTIKMDFTGSIRIRIDEWANVNRNVYLIDKVENINYLISNTPADIFLNAGTYTERFVLAFRASGTLSTEEIVGSQFYIYAEDISQDIMIVNADQVQIENVKLYDVLGKEIQAWDITSQHKEGTKLRLKTNRVSSGIYYMKLTSKEGIAEKKIYLGF